MSLFTNGAKRAPLVDGGYPLSRLWGVDISIQKLKMRCWHINMEIKKDTQENEATRMLVTTPMATLRLSMIVNHWSYGEVGWRVRSPSQMSRLLILHLVCTWVPFSTSRKVFSFEKSQEVNETSTSLSFASLDSETSEDLPSRFHKKKHFLQSKEQRSVFHRFVLCWSHKQGAWDQRGVFHIYGINNQPWLTIRSCRSWLIL